MLQLGKLFIPGQGCSAIPTRGPFLFLRSGRSWNGQDEIETHLVDPPSPFMLLLLVQIFLKEV